MSNRATWPFLALLLALLASALVEEVAHPPQIRAIVSPEVIASTAQTVKSLRTLHSTLVNAGDVDGAATIE